MSKRLSGLGICILVFAIFITVFKLHEQIQSIHNVKQNKITKSINNNLLSIQFMRNQMYPGSKISIVKQLPDGTNYHQYLTSYESDGLKIYALLTIPMGSVPKNGWPVILFNHGYIPPVTYETYPTVGQYADYYPVFSSNGYIVFKPDYRGNGNSQGKPSGAYFSPDYTIDDLNALSSIKKFKDVNPHKIGIWAHSMGGNIALRALEVDPNDIKVAVIWGGVVGSYSDILFKWHTIQTPMHPFPSSTYQSGSTSRQSFVLSHGTPSTNPEFWDSIDPIKNLDYIKSPIQLDVGGSDSEVPPRFSDELYTDLRAIHKPVEFYEYSGDNHNISNNFTQAMQRSLAYFNTYLKGGESL